MALTAFREAIGKEAAVPGCSATPAGTWLGQTERLPTLKEAEECLMAEALRRAGGNQGAAATLLGISRQALNKRLLRK